MGLTIIQDNPNPKALTIDLGVRDLGAISKLVLPRPKPETAATIDPAAISPLAGAIFDAVKLANRVDLIRREEDGHILLTVTNMLTDWDHATFKKPRARLLKTIEDALNSGRTDLLINETEAQRRLPMLDFYDASRNQLTRTISRTFHDAVLPTLKKDGGALELRHIEVGGDGGITLQVLMLGSCSTCTSAETVTLKNAEEAIGVTLGQIKGAVENQGNADVQKLHLSGIQQLEAPNGFIMRQAPAGP